MLCAELVAIGQVVRERRMNMWKVNNNDNIDNTDQGQIFDQNNSLEFSTQVS